MLVKWDLPSAQQLAALGFRQTPSPIERQYAYPGFQRPMEHQRKMAGFMSLHRRCFNLGDMGCVDSETEYLSPTGWRRMDAYDGGKVAQYNLDGTVDFVQPKEYVKLPCDEMIRFKTKYGVDQLLSPEHRVLYVTSKGKTQVRPADYVETRQADAVYGWKGRFLTTFKPNLDSSMPLNDAQLRLQVAVMADGWFANKSNAKCVVRLKKERKKERLRALLFAAGVAFKEKTPEYASAPGFTVFVFHAPMRCKVFDESFWKASLAQLHIIADEVVQWDGSVRESGTVEFFTRERRSADFIQYAFSATGRTSRMTVHQREAGVDFVVSARTGNSLIGLAGVDDNGVKTKTVWREPSTDGFKYCFMVPSTFLVFRRNGCVFMSGNTGKTRATVWAADYLMSIGEVKRVLVLAPLSILRTAWEADIFKAAMHRTVGIAHGSDAIRKRVIASGCEFVVMNHDGVKSAYKDLMAAHFDLIIVDEATAFKNSTTKRWKALAHLLRDDTYLWLLTGTPAANSPEDAYGLAKLVNPGGVPKFLTGWREATMLKVSTFTWVPRSDAQQRVFAAMQPAIRVDKRDCIDLPPVTYVEREIEMSPTQQKYYSEMKKQMLMEAAGTQITAVNAGVLLSKLLQIAAGAAYSDDGKIVDFRPTERLNEMLDVINECREKVIVFANFRHSIEVIKECLDNNKIPAGIISGDVSVSERTRLIQSFQEDDKLKVLIIQPQAAAHGVTLTAASVTIWFSPVSSLELWNQANARMDRPGQKNAMTIVKLIGSPIERKVYGVLEKRGADQTALLGLFHDEINT